MSDLTDREMQIEQREIFREDTPGKSQTDLLLESLNNAFGGTITVTLTKEQAMDLAAAMHYGSYLMGECRESAELARFRQTLDAEIDKMNTSTGVPR